jgi:hypothetical protein
MTRIVDLWRAVDPEARLVSGSPDGVSAAVRGVERTRAAPPHLPPAVDGELLVIDASLARDRTVESLLNAVREAGLAPSAAILAETPRSSTPEPAGDTLPVLASAHPPASLVTAAQEYLADETSALARLGLSLRLAAAEAALADPRPSAPAGLIAGRLGRGVAVAVDGALAALHPRPSGRAVAARFAAAFARMLAAPGTRTGGVRRTRDGLWLIEQRLAADAGVWLFDDLPFARVDEVAAEALAAVIRALLRRPAVVEAAPRTAEARPLADTFDEVTPAPTADGAGTPQPVPDGAAARSAAERTDPLSETLLAVARANGRVSVAARALGVHRNTVLYRLRVARAERGIDPRRPEDALRLLREAESR